MENNQKKVTYSFKNYIQNGIGADLIRLTGIKNICDENGVVLHLCKNDKWDHVPISAQYRNWEYYFEPTLPIDINDEFPDVGEYVSHVFKTTLPTNSTLSKFQHRSKLMKDLYKPQKIFLDNIINYTKNELPYLENNKYIAIHIRRGDKTSGPWKESNAIDVKQYLHALDEYIISCQDKVSTVFIITDSQNVINEISPYVAEYQNKGITIFWDKNEIRRDGYSYKLYKYGYSDSERIDEITTFMKNMHIMQNSTKIIGSRMSYFFMTAELLKGTKEISLSDNKRYPVDFYD